MYRCDESKVFTKDSSSALTPDNRGARTFDKIIAFPDAKRSGGSASPAHYPIAALQHTLVMSYFAKHDCESRERARSLAGEAREEEKERIKRHHFLTLCCSRAAGIALLPLT